MNDYMKIVQGAKTMNDYTKIAKLLRNCLPNCYDCRAECYSSNSEQIFKDAADAIEKLVKENQELRQWKRGIDPPIIPVWATVDLRSTEISQKDLEAAKNKAKELLVDAIIENDCIQIAVTRHHYGCLRVNATLYISEVSDSQKSLRPKEVSTNNDEANPIQHRNGARDS